MIDTPARRREIIEILYFADDYVKIRPLAVRFGVSYATIRNDVDVLSLSYRISSQTGPNGGIKLETKRKNLRFLDPDETAALLRIINATTIFTGFTNFIHFFIIVIFPVRITINALIDSFH